MEAAAEEEEDGLGPLGRVVEKRKGVVRAVDIEVTVWGDEVVGWL